MHLAPSAPSRGDTLSRTGRVDVTHQLRTVDNAAGYEPLPRFTTPACCGDLRREESLRDILLRRMQALDRAAHHEDGSPRVARPKSSLTHVACVITSSHRDGITDGKDWPPRMPAANSTDDASTYVEPDRAYEDKAPYAPDESPAQTGAPRRHTTCRPGHYERAGQREPSTTRIRPLTCNNARPTRERSPSATPCMAHRWHTRTQPLATCGEQRRRPASLSPGSCGVRWARSSGCAASHSPACSSACRRSRPARSSRRVGTVAPARPARTRSGVGRGVPPARHRPDVRVHLAVQRQQRITAPPLLRHATQNWDEAFEIGFPGIAGTDWELLSSLGVLMLGIIAAVAVRRGRHPAVTSLTS